VALALDRKARGDKYFGNATVITNLSLLLDEKGEYEKAEPLFQEALQIYEQATGRDSANYRTALFRMAEHQASRGDAAAAERLIREVLRTSRRHFQQTLATQSEREQLAYRGEVRGPLNLYLSLTATDAAKAEDVYAEVLAWKAPVSALQALIRRARRADQSAGRAQAGELYTALEDASHKLSVLSRAAPDPKHPNQLRQDLQDTSDRVEALQRDLAAASGEFRQAQDRQRRTADDVRTALPDDAVLVDLLEYARFQPAGKGGASDVAPLHLAAFVLRKGRPVVRVELGPVAPLTQALDEWRRELARPGTEARHGAELRAALWQPLESHLGDARVVLLSPSGALARLPFAALPGREPGRYLIEDRALAVVPVPDLLPDLVASHSPAGWEPSLLVVSAVDFDAAGAAGDAAAAAVPQPARPGPTLKWPPLPGTRAEADALSRAFRGRYPGGTVVDLRAGQATDATVRREAPHRAYLHFATHGYFAPPQLKSAAAAASRSEQAGGGDLFVQKDVAGFHPGLLSGLVLAGANRPDAGMLTALEVENLDLSGVELATLSACETGLGEYAGGEGLLGLQRAFQTAGARTVLAGLWKVDDAATQALMTEFYARLWDGKHSKLEALRQAQLTLLHTYDPAAGRQRGVGGVAVDAPARVAGGKLPPFYWAAFALSGDWR
jgi:CHAT domain-containing protein